jgi:hypothetical protein
VAQARRLAPEGSLLDALADVPLFQLWTAESVAALAAALRAPAGPVVEVGAGDGRLSAALGAAGVPCVATDDGSLAAVAGFTAGAVGWTDRWRADGTWAPTTTAVLYRRDGAC